MTDIELKTYIEWTKEDRIEGECPAPYGSDVTVWYSAGTIRRDDSPQWLNWGDAYNHILGYLVHSTPEEEISDE